MQINYLIKCKNEEIKWAILLYGCIPKKREEVARETSPFAGDTTSIASSG
jgi:hypothetical protein